MTYLTARGEYPSIDDAMAAEYSLGSVESDAAMVAFRASYPAAMSELAITAAALKRSSDASNRATGELWVTTTIPRAQELGQRILSGDMSILNTYSTMLTGLLNGGRMWLGSDMSATERLIRAVQDITRTTARSVADTIADAARTAGEVIGAGAKSAFDNAGMDSTSAIKLAVLLAAGAALVYTLKK